MKNIAFIILNYNGTDDTLVCLSSLGKMNIPSGVSFTVYVVDNASQIPTDKISNFKFPPRKYSGQAISNEGIEYIFIQNTQNLGFSGGNNVGIRQALDDQADFIGLLNNDTTVEEFFLEHMLEGFEDKKVSAVVPKIYFMKGHEFHHDRYTKEEKGKVIWYAGGIMDWNNLIGAHKGVDEVDRGQFDQAEVTDFATGCCMLMKREVWEKVGLLDEKYFLYYEDSDLSIRMKQKGYTILYYPKAYIYHKNAGSTGGSGSSLQDYYITRNRLLFGMRYAPLRTKAHLIREALSLLQSSREWQKKGVQDFFTGKFGKGSYNSKLKVKS